MVTVTVTGTAGVKESLLGLDSWIAAAEEVSLQTASEGGKRRCRRDVLRQTVPNTGCSDWNGPVEYKHVLANISRSRCNARALWTKWNGLVADNVAHAASASILSLVRA